MNVLLRSLPLLLTLTMLCSGAAAAAKKSGHYVDTKNRFELELAPGWDLAPIPGDTSGMKFMRKVNGVPASLYVQVEKTAPGQTVVETLDKAERRYKVDLGYNQGTDTPTELNGVPATRRTLTVYASGDKNTVRAVEIIAVHAFGYAHTLHFETLEPRMKTMHRDLDRMTTTFVPIAGKALTGGLGGVWINTGGGPDLTLDDDGAFQMGPLRGGWQADGGRLVLKIPTGAEAYRYVLNDDTLTLSSPNLGGDLVFRKSTTNRRVIASSSAELTPKARTTALTKEELYGTWVVVDAKDGEPLRLQLASSGSVSFGGLAGRWSYSTGRITIRSIAGETMTYAASMTAGQLILSSGDLDEPLTLRRE
ncbi:MAG TPA: hypothetical protein VGF99_09500 [Myxococcota bacterium]